jgi:hypothetical protein
MIYREGIFEAVFCILSGISSAQSWYKNPHYPEDDIIMLIEFTVLLEHTIRNAMSCYGDVLLGDY